MPNKKARITKNGLIILTNINKKIPIQSLCLVSIKFLIFSLLFFFSVISDQPSQAMFNVPQDSAPTSSSLQRQKQSKTTSGLKTSSQSKKIDKSLNEAENTNESNTTRQTEISPAPFTERGQAISTGKAGGTFTNPLSPSRSGIGEE